MKKRVAFELINLENQGNSVVKTFLSNPKSSSFHRPANSINVATGFPKFITIEEFLNGGFIKDNSIFIRTTVEDVWTPANNQVKSVCMPSIFEKRYKVIEKSHDCN